MSKPETTAEAPSVPTNFIINHIKADVADNVNDGKVVTRFPPEPNGYLHIGHAKAICLNFGIANDFASKCHLRFDDTNPEKEDVEYVDSIKEDIKWLGFDWGENLFYSSDYFQKIYEVAIDLIKADLAFVCNQTQEEQRLFRGDLTNKGKPSPSRDNSIESNLDLFSKMKDGVFAEGEYVLRAKIDMSSPNMHMRDPVIYRVKKMAHHKVGSKWNIYPMYDFTHCLSDSIEGITHSLCTLEFVEHRPFYDWLIEKSGLACHPQQIEFARLNLEYTIMSKRKLHELVEKKIVTGWDDPRLPTLSGMRRRGYPAEAIRVFTERIGVTKKESSIRLSTLESIVREELASAKRVFGVVDPLKVTITNWEEDTQWIDCAYFPHDKEKGSRSVPFDKVIYIEKSDFMLEPPKKFFRLGPLKSVRLKYAYVITCDEVIQDDSGEVIELKCHYIKETFRGVTPEGMKKVKGIVNWVSASNGIPVETRLYDRLFNVPFPGKERDFTEDINPASKQVMQSVVEPSLATIERGTAVQFERQGYFVLDSESGSDKDNFIFNRIITLKDTWHKIEAANDILKPDEVSAPGGS